MGLWVTSTDKDPGLPLLDPAIPGAAPSSGF